jgi:hypothetical protein
MDSRGELFQDEILVRVKVVRTEGCEDPPLPFFPPPLLTRAFKL